MKRKFTLLTLGIGLSLSLGLFSCSNAPAPEPEVIDPAAEAPEAPEAEAQAGDQANADAPKANAISSCPGEYAGWTLVDNYNTKSYALALCQQGDSSVLVGNEKSQPDALIDARVTNQEGGNIIARGQGGTTYRISEGRLAIRREGEAIAREKIRGEGERQQGRAQEPADAAQEPAAN